ncbi:hypothetical protein C2G38_2205327 [Gigaspora rosea]|uniref:Uncharacterized protein n=1 Tax=Gigaspora rosea TaxID=44941 RepID=A0A397UU77_9GLOM|nr:hypothetical protein C2G38_2205327 [Gigaspora rosea]
MCIADIQVIHMVLKRQHTYKDFKKKLDKKEPDMMDIGTENENDSNNADKDVDNVPEDLLELENIKMSFLKF